MCHQSSEILNAKKELGQSWNENYEDVWEEEKKEKKKKK